MHFVTFTVANFKYCKQTKLQPASSISPNNHHLTLEMPGLGTLLAAQC